MGRLVGVLLQELFGRDLNGLFAHAVTVHPYSQRSMLRYGFKECGYLLAHTIESTTFKGISERLPDRGSVLIGYLPLKHPSETQTIYLPASHQDVILGIYSDLLIPVAPGQPAGPADLAAQTTPAEVSLTMHLNRRVATLHLRDPGVDVMDRLREALYRVKKARMQCVEVYLNLANRFTPLVSERLEEEGFLFTGILPGVSGGDRLLLQYFNGITADYDSIKVESPRALELLGYIRRHDPFGGLSKADA